MSPGLPQRDQAPKSSAAGAARAGEDHDALLPDEGLQGHCSRPQALELLKTAETPDLGAVWALIGSRQPIPAI